MFWFWQSQAADSDAPSIHIDEQITIGSPLPSPCKLIQQCNAAVTKAGDDIECATDQNDDTDSDNEKKKPVFK